MAIGWVKSLQCKSTAFDDVALSPKPKPKKPLLPLSSSSCSKSSQALRDVVFLFPKKPPEPKPSRVRPNRPNPASPSPDPAGPASPFPTLAELPAGHSSRRVVELIFSSSWRDAGAPFPGRVEMVFRVLNPARSLARFEACRSSARSLSPAGDPRCAADGNEMLRFHCSPPSAGDGIYDASVASIGDGIRTFAGSGGAHESSGGGPGRRAMLVCRVIAGRVGSGPESGFESVRGSGKGELVVFDPRAVLPCFLIIYTI